MDGKFSYDFFRVLGGVFDFFVRTIGKFTYSFFCWLFGGVVLNDGISGKKNLLLLVVDVTPNMGLYGLDGLYIIYMLMIK